MSVSTKNTSQRPPFRVGYGYDIHRLVEGRPLFMGGVEIEHSHGLLGHSDADVLLHAISDALLGAVNMRDIGYHFPDTDPAYKGADSKVLLRAVADLIAEAGYALGNVDCTIVAQAPKMNPHIPAMQRCIAECLAVDANQISIKATTNEELDATGRKEGIAATAVALLYAL